MPTRVFALLIAALLTAPGRSLAAPELTPKEIYQKASPAVVLLLCVDSEGNGELGTGSLIDDKGHVLTNAHVVLKPKSKEPFEVVKVYFRPAKLSGDPKRDLVNPRMARVLKADRGLDLAVLELEEAPGRLSPLPIGDAEEVMPGESVVAIGHPEQGGLWTLTSGVVSTIISDLGGVSGKNVFQTDASINRGNSGGPLINRQGAMIGVNTSMARKAADGLAITSVNFSVKSSVVKDWLAAAGLGVEPMTFPPAPVPQVEPPAKPEQAEAPRADPKSEPKPEPIAEAPKPEPAAPVAQAPNPEPKAEAAPAKDPSSPEAKAVLRSPEEAPKPGIVTPKKPYSIDDVLAREIAEMEQLGDDMAAEVEKRRAMIR